METPQSDGKGKKNGSRYLSVAQETCSTTPPLPETTRKGGMSTSLSLELKIPHIRPEAFPWVSDNVEIHASFSFGSSRSLISLPSVIDLGTLLLSTEEGQGEPARKVESVEVEIVGNDNGVTFALGKASLPLPTGQLMERSSTADHQFRTSLVGAAGMRTGTLVGSFRSRGRTIKDPTNRGPILPAVGSATTESTAAKAVLCGASDRGIEIEAPGHPTGELNDESLENQAIELLDTANKILASSDLPAARPHIHVCDESSSACGDEKAQDADDASQTQTPGIRLAGASYDFKQISHGGVGHSPRKVPSEEDRRYRQPRLPTAGFKFEPTTGNIEWQRIASVNVAKVDREKDLQTLKQFLPEIAVGKLNEDDIDANPVLVNAFRLAQLQAQYLLHCQQVLQRQRDGLQSAVSTMETEVEGNSQGATAIKNRVRLLRKETRKQDKIINGYAALLRTHNPSLASKVVLDEKGRLRVFRVDGEVTRQKGNGKRRARSRSRRDRHCTADQNLKSRVMSTSRGRSPAPLSVASGTTDDAREERARLSRVDARAKQTAEDLGAGGACGADHGSRLDSEDREVEGQHSQRLREQEGTGFTEAGREARTSAGSAGVLAATGSGTAIGLLSAADGENTRGGSGCGLNGVDAISTMTGSAESSQNGSKNAIFVVGAKASDATAPPPCGDGWEAMSSELSKSERLAVVGSGLRSEGADGRPCVEQGNLKAAGHTPRLVTVTVKPKPNPTAASTSSPEKGDTDFPLQELQRHHQCQEDLAPRASTNDNNDRNSNSSNNSSTWPRNDAGGSEASLGAPRSNTVRPEARASENFSPACASDEFRKRTPLAGSTSTAETASSTRGALRGSSQEIYSHAADPIIPAPVADASRLGLEGDDFPDSSEFDVDDISEIDAGGEWTGREGAGSLSS